MGEALTVSQSYQVVYILRELVVQEPTGLAQGSYDKMQQASGLAAM